MTHAGHSYHESTPDGIAAVAEQERQAIVGAAEKLRAAGIPCPIVSAGSTPTAMHSRDFTGITEMRPGVYVFNDLDQEFIGSCGAGDLALSVLASVIGHYPHRNQVLIDAGALALSKDISAQEFRPQVGYGTIVDPPARDMAVVACSQEHGFVGADGADSFRQPAGRFARAHPAQPRLHHRGGLRPLLRGRQRPRRRQVGGRRLRPHQRVVKSLDRGPPGPLMIYDAGLEARGPFEHENYNELTVWPPSTVSTLPVMKVPASDASSSSAPSRCSGWPMRRWGMRSIRRWPPGVFQKSLFISVSM